MNLDSRSWSLRLVNKNVISHYNTSYISDNISIQELAPYLLSHR